MMFSRVVLVAAVALLAAAVVDAKRVPRPEPDVPEETTKREIQWVLRKDEQVSGFKKLLRGLEDFDIKRTFGRMKKFTLIVPSNDFLKKFDKKNVVAGYGAVSVVVLKHMIRDVVDLSDASRQTKDEAKSKQSDGKLLERLVARSALKEYDTGNDDVEFKVNRFGIYVNGQKVVKIINCENGIIYVIDGILPPDEYFNSANFVVYLRRMTVGASFNESTRRELFYESTSRFANRMVSRMLEEGNGDLVFQTLQKKGKNNQIVMFAPMNKAAKRQQRIINREDAPNKFTKIVQEHLVKLPGRVTRLSLIEDVKKNGGPFTLTNENGREIVIDYRVNRNGFEILTVNGFDAPREVAEIYNTNGAIIPIDGFIWFDYGRFPKGNLN